MTKGSSHLESVADTVTDLNSWNTAHVDEPDYMIRIEAFGKCPSHLGCVQNFEEVVLLLVNNAMFFLLTVRKEYQALVLFLCSLLWPFICFV